MKRIYLPLLLTACLSNGLSAQEYELAAEPMRDSVVVEYYFCFARAWDKTTFYTNIFHRYQDTLCKKDNLEKSWNKYIKQELKLKNYTGFIKGPYYDSVFAVKNRIKWMEEQPDTIPVKGIHYAAGPEEKPGKKKQDSPVVPSEQ
ncbi:MAG: hypothetical protein PVF73_07030 [Bacteroidales bacterium]|jgi:hypothetical protein